jgi:uncharacterized protein YndB with AHSA1/START domain
MASVSNDTFSLRLERVLPATPEQVYEAWTNPAQVARWFSPSTEFTTIVHTLDTKIGGKYRIEMKHASGNSHIACGEYVALQRNRHLAFTWRWEGNAAMPDTLVTIELSGEAAGTRIVLKHAQFDSQAQCDEHERGWTACLTRLNEPALY